MKTIKMIIAVLITFGAPIIFNEAEKKCQIENCPKFVKTVLGVSAILSIFIFMILFEALGWVTFIGYVAPGLED